MTSTAVKSECHALLTRSQNAKASSYISSCTLQGVPNCKEESTPYVDDCPAVFGLVPLASNAAPQPLPEAEAERTLEAVGCRRLFGWGSLPRR